MLSRLQIKTIQLTKKLFFYLPASLYDWNTASGRFNWIATPKRCLYARIQFLNMICLTIQSVFAIWLHLNDKLEKKYSTVLLIQHSLLVTECLPVLAIKILVVLNNEQLEYVNKLVKFRHQLFQGSGNFIIDISNVTMLFNNFFCFQIFGAFKQEFSFWNILFFQFLF